VALAPDAAREYLRSERRDTVVRTLDCATAVAAGWEDGATTDREQVVPPLRAALDRAGVLDSLPTVLSECVAAAGGELRATPVAAPPYVVITSVGPVLRATLEAGRLVVTIGAFRVERRDGTTRYVHHDPSPADAVSVARR
jgi:hypothetical protein